MEGEGDLGLKMAIAFSKKSNQRPRHDSGDESHDHEHREDALRKDAHIITYVECNKFH